MTVIPISKTRVLEIAIHRKSRLRHFVLSGGVEVAFDRSSGTLFCRKCKRADDCSHTFAVRNSHAFRTPQHIAFEASSRELLK